MQTEYNGRFGFEKLKGDLYGKLHKAYMGNLLSSSSIYASDGVRWPRKYLMRKRIIYDKGRQSKQIHLYRERL